ncbi:hypothetical protein [Corallococcus macrosporus]|uniref:Uncharacterized protein n=1 Tax=Myxococcus fulvus (strain ATCC BAA-855 / HW-1) TaxID=483219 RepID=F8C6L2_MYXFH|nr:hypothetical protein [Corallococcus macrosporus]AEI65601.1 hypothetical protein LILAB_18495 [Corallococcus macrosporus]
MSAALNQSQRPTKRLAPVGAFGAFNWRHLTTRQRDVFQRPRTMATLLELVRERPRGGCTVCWRDLSRIMAGRNELACARRDGGGSPYCQLFVRACFAEVAERCEAAKASLLVELEAAGGVH